MIRIEYLPAHLFGAHLKRYHNGGRRFYKLYLCLIPTLPVVVSWSRWRTGSPSWGSMFSAK